jgi:hypothetical protein
MHLSLFFPVVKTQRPTMLKWIHAKSVHTLPRAMHKALCSKTHNFHVANITLSALQSKNQWSSNVAMSLAKEGRMEEAVNAFTESPDKWTAPYLISKLPDINSTFKIFDTLKSSRMHADQFILRALVGACRRCQQLDRVSSLWDYAESINLKLDATSLKMFAELCNQMGDVALAKKMLDANDVCLVN